MKHPISLFLVLALAVLAAQCVQPSSGANPNTASPQGEESYPEAVIKRGEYLVTIGLCDDCHTPKVFTENGPEFDLKRRLMGHPADEQLPPVADKKMTAPGQWTLFSPGFTAISGAWGTSFAANLTPDDTGIGVWTEAQFFKAIREGKSKGLDGTRSILPPMPWQNISQMSDDDLRAVYAYLKSLPPIKNAVPNPLPPSH